MKTSNLHINLPRSNFSATGSGSDAIMHSGSSSPVLSPSPETPLGQIVFNPGQPRTMIQRFNSVSSTATSWSDDQSEDSTRPVNMFSDAYWPQEDDDLLLKVYQDYTDNPTVAPFAGRIPPSGIVHRVAQETNRVAIDQGRHFPHSLSSIRRRLLLLCNRNYSQSCRSRSVSRAASPLNPVNVFGSIDEQIQGVQGLTPRPSESPDGTMRPRFGSWMWPPQQQYPQQPGAPLSPVSTPERSHVSTRPLASPFCDQSFNNQPLGSRSASLSSNSSVNEEIYQPSPRRQSSVVDPLQQQVEGDESTDTWRRKRESLKMKRGII